MDVDQAKVAIISANLGDFDTPVEHAEQELPPGVEYLYFRRFTDSDFPRRDKTMTPRLQARIVKMFMWQFVPGYDYYLWIDSSCRLSTPTSVAWFLNQCQGVDMAVFKHPHRQTIQEEADYLKHRLSINCPYITPRYANEDIDGELREIQHDHSFKDEHLFASTAFIVRDSRRSHRLFKEWWYHTSRYHAVDQLALPYVIAKNTADVRVIPDNYLKSEYISYVRS